MLSPKIWFVHIPKNAGTSIASALYGLAQGCYRTYVCHNTPFSKIENHQQLIVLRDPVDRFCSGVNYVIKYQTKQSRATDIYSQYKNLAFFLKTENFITPNQWCEALKDTDHRYHNIVKKLIFERRPYDNVDDKPIPVVYHFAPQSYWINKPVYIIIYNNLKEEFNEFCEEHFKKPITLQHRNCSNQNNKLTTENVSFIKHLYTKDVCIYDISSSIPKNQRIIQGIEHSAYLDPEFVKLEPTIFFRQYLSKTEDAKNI